MREAVSSSSSSALVKAIIYRTALLSFSKNISRMDRKSLERLQSHWYYPTRLLSTPTEYDFPVLNTLFLHFLTQFLCVFDIKVLDFFLGQTPMGFDFL